MSGLAFGCDDAVAEWVSQRIKSKVHKPYVAVGVVRDGKLCGGVVLNGWLGPDANVDITIASERGFSRGAIREIYDLAFGQLKASRITAHTKRSNKAMQRLLPRLGFKFEGMARRYFGAKRADDALIFALFPENRKF